MKQTKLHEHITPTHHNTQIMMQPVSSTRRCVRFSHNIWTILNSNRLSPANNAPILQVAGSNDYTVFVIDAFRKLLLMLPTSLILMFVLLSLVMYS